MDPLFGSRLEDRFSMEASSFESVAGELGLTENERLGGWVANVYFDTTELAMPLCNVVRARRYSLEKPELSFDDGTYFIDHMSLNGNEKTKVRMPKSTIESACGELDTKYDMRLTGFRPYTATRYVRKLLEGDDIRVTVDTNIEGVVFDEDGKPEPLPMPGLAQVEVKHRGGANGIARILESVGALPTISKHHLAYNQHVFSNRDSIKEGLVDETPDIEYEVKFDSASDAAFQRFFILVSRGLAPGFRPWGRHLQPYIITSINEYRSVLNSEDTARVMYYGHNTQHVVTKDRGQFIGDVLKRTEIDKKMPRAEWAPLLSPAFATTKRVKKVWVVESEASGKLYTTSVDLNQRADGQMLYQNEIEYWRSQTPSVGDAAQEALDEINSLARIMESVDGMKRSTLTKEDWASGRAVPVI